MATKSSSLNPIKPVRKAATSEKEKANRLYGANVTHAPVHGKAAPQQPKHTTAKHVTTKAATQAQTKK